MLVATCGDVKHGIHHDTLHNAAQAAGTELEFDGLVHDILIHLGGEGELHAVHLEELHILLHDGILRFGEDSQQRLARQGVEVGEHRHAADNLGDEAEALEVLRRDVLHHVLLVDAERVLHRAVAHHVGIEALGNLLLYAVEGSATDEEDVLRVYGYHLLLGVLAPTLGWYIHNRTLKEFEQTLLHTLTAHIARNGWIVALAGYLVNLVNEYDTLFRGLHVIVGYLEQSGEDTLDVFAHIACLGEHRGIHDGEGHLEQLGDGACQQCLARTGATHNNNVALLYLHLVGLILLHEALVVVIHRHREVSLGIVLPYHILVEECLYLLGLG